MIKNIYNIEINKKGSTRLVILTKNYAFKFPSFYSWESFLRGLLWNMQESLFWTLQDSRLCPIIFSIKGGFLNVMQRAEELSREEFFEIDFESFVKSPNLLIPVENKLDSFGKINGKIVAIDYGS